MKKVAIQGIRGSFHDIAAHQYFATEDLDIVCCNTFEQVFDSVRDDPSIIAFVAIENTIAGSLLHNYELLRDSGLSLIAATEHTDRNYTEVDMTLPICIVMGSEEKGIYEENLKLCTDKVRLPMTGVIESLNVSVAAGVFIYEAVRQRGL